MNTHWTFNDNQEITIHFFRSVDGIAAMFKITKRAGILWLHGKGNRQGRRQSRLPISW